MRASSLTRFVVCLLASGTHVQAHAQDTSRYVVRNHGRPAGALEVISAADSAVVLFRQRDRMELVRHTTRYKFDASRRVVALERSGDGVAPGSAANAAAAAIETFRLRDGAASWSSPGESANARIADAAYEVRRPTPYDQAVLAARLLRSPGGTLPTLPAGTARLQVIVDTLVNAPGDSLRVRLVAVENDAAFPRRFIVWLDSSGELFASAASSWFTIVRSGAESVQPLLRRIEMQWFAREAELMARRLTHATDNPLVIRNGDVFDSERGQVRPRTTIVIEKGRIAAVGPSDSVAVPSGATVIDASGKSVLPGLWDMHVHHSGLAAALGNAPARLAAGITTARDLAADPDLATLLRDQADAGALLSPRLLLAGFIEGPGERAGPSEAIARDEAEARAWVARYHSLGYRHIKLYNLVQPDLVATIAGEAHRRGMRISGHIPRGISVPVALHLGFDEIHHHPFLITTFFPDSFFIPTARSYVGVWNAVAPSFDIDSEQMTGLIALLREHGTVIDGTFNRDESRARPLPDGEDAVFGPTLAWQPPLMRRGQVPASPKVAAIAETRTLKNHQLLKRLFDAGVTIVAGTDNVAGLSYHGELEIYQRAGIPAVAVLQIATINAARVAGQERDYGSVAPGKVADLVIVPGHPEQDVRHLRCAETVVRAGRVYSTAELYRLAGFDPGRCAFAN